MKVPDKNDLNCSGRLGLLYFKKNYPEFLQYLLDTYTNTTTEKLAEKLYLYYNGLIKPPKCPICGKYRPFLDFLSRGYQEYCSSKCSNSSKDVQNKKEVTCLKNHGVKHACQNKDIKDKLINTYTKNHGGMGNASNSVKEKQKKTMLKKYGCEYSLQNNNLLNKSKQTWVENYGGVGLASPIIKEKANDTIKRLYGGWGMSSDIIRKKIINTNFDKYGCKNPMMNNIVRSEWKKLFFDKYGVEEPFHLEWVRNKIREAFLIKYQDITPARNEDVKNKIKQTCLERYGVERATKLDIVKEKTKQTCLERYGVEWPSLLPQAHTNGMISKINLRFSDELSTNNISHQLEFPIQNRSYDFKIDNILLEINPYITHNSTWCPFGEPKSIDYHFNKTKLAIDNKFRIINIWDWDDTDKIINSLTNKETIYARNCIIKEVSKKETKEFLNTYHFQNNCNGQKIRIGLYYDDELIELMTFGKPRYNKKFEWEILRLCSKFGYKVIGGSEKLFKYFINNYNPQSIISYCDNSKFKGDVYERLGFNLKNYGKPTKHWYNPKTTTHITDNLLRQRGFDQLFKTNYGKGTSNEELMLVHEFVEIYDAGQSVWVWNSKK